MGEAERQAFYARSVAGLGKLLIDALRAPWLSEAWVRRQVSVPNASLIDRLHREYPGKGILFISAHLGSFEIVPHVSPLFNFPLTLVVRPFRPSTIHEWWTKLRSRRGCDSIDRADAVREMIKRLKQGRNISFVCDQNVRREQAVFVPHFGVLAATARSIGIVILRTGAPVVIGSLEDTGFDRYEIRLEQCDLSAVVNDSALSLDEKVQQLTLHVTRELEARILRQPERWFWFHRRWRTRPESDPTPIYGETPR
jgi:KDO2-lipid IV(A) lauroyltransferase